MICSVSIRDVVKPAILRQLWTKPSSSFSLQPQILKSKWLKYISISMTRKGLNSVKTCPKASK